MRIKEPGFYELSDTDYFADPCPKPSLTQTLAKVLLRRSPRHMWHQHPRLNPHYAPDDNEVFDLGSAAHAMLFGGRKILACDYPDWRTKVAREHRDKIRAAGDLPLLYTQYERVCDMLDALRQEVTIGDGRKEITAIAEIKGVWLRTKIDWLAKSDRIALDYKTTGVQIERAQIHSYAFAQGWHLQAAMHARILDYLSPQTVGMRQHVFVLQEAYRPYVVHTCQMSEAMMELGHAQIGEAITTFKRCLERDQWPGSDGLLILTPPAWGIRQQEEAEHAAKV